MVQLDSDLREIVADGLPVLTAALAKQDRALPKHVQRELDAFLNCRWLKAGFTWLHCGDCDHHRLVPFQVSGWQCPHCLQPMVVRTILHGPTETYPRILAGLEKPTDPPAAA